MKTAELVELIENLPAHKKKVIEDMVSALMTDSSNEKHYTDVKPGFGGAKGIIGFMADDFDEPLDDFKDYM
jgi:hypothetical protein